MVPERTTFRPCIYEYKICGQLKPETLSVVGGVSPGGHIARIKVLFSKHAFKKKILSGPRFNKENPSKGKGEGANGSDRATLLPSNNGRGTATSIGPNDLSVQDIGCVMSQDQTEANA